MANGVSRNAADSAALSLNWDKLTAAVAGYQREPWKLYQKPFQVTDHIFYVGNQFVASYLVDTGDGLVLIDANFNEMVPQVIHSIHLMGYDPADIRYIFLSHAHIDHCGGARYMQSFAAPGTQIYLGQEDMFFLTQRRELLLAPDPDTVPAFDAIPYDREKPMSIGDVTFHFVHTPGHTPGCTTFLIDTSIGGAPLTAAMHGGLGVMMAGYDMLKRYDLPLELHQAFHDQLLRCRELHVDVIIPSHNKDWDIISLAEKDDGSHQVFIDPTAWSRTMDFRRDAFEKME